MKRIQIDKKNEFWKKGYWLERSFFIIGSIFLFYSGFFTNYKIDNLSEDISYFEKNINQIEIQENTREQWLIQYNNSVSNYPQNKTLVSFNAFKLYSSIDQLLTTLEILANEKGKGKTQDLVRKKNNRIEFAEQLLKNGNEEILIKLLNDISELHEKNVESLTKKVMVEMEQLKEKYSVKKIEGNFFNIIGSILLAIAFLLREYKDYKKIFLK